ncbi:MAG: asparagine synthase-related protein [Planctomycetota bacterium]|jgi:asparagine synthase (glutamine-hydrolysing)
MIGGYVYREIDAALEARLRGRLDGSHTRIPVWDRGCLFHDEPFRGGSTAQVVSDELVGLSQDLLVATGPDGEYRRFDPAAELGPLFARSEIAAFDAIASDFRMVAVRRCEGATTLFLVSHRAGSGRIYYRATEAGVVFSSDLRFLFGLVGGEVSRRGIYAILKYGAVPEPLTIARDIRAVPPAHYLRHEIERGAQQSRPYFKLRFPCEGEEAGARTEDQILQPAAETLRRSARFLQTLRPAILLSGGIDSSLYGCYLSEGGKEPLQGFYCAFGDDDPELAFAERIANHVGGHLHVARMGKEDALGVLGDVTRWTDHPFSDFSSLPITFLLRHARERMGERALLVECNGGDDCFGFPDLASETKHTLKHRFPRFLKRALAGVLRRFGHWKWASHEGTLARLSALADVHESTPLDYFLVLAPVGYLGLKGPRAWDDTLHEVMQEVFFGCGEGDDRLSYRAQTTIRQLLHVNSRRWAAKALSVGESLGMRVVYPYIWREVLVEQGNIPWRAKIRDGVVKWPLKRLLEQHLPRSFIYREKSGFVPPFAQWLTHEDFNQRVREVLLDRDASVTEVAPAPTLEQLLSDARRGRKLRHSILNFLWGALFTEMWLREHARG